MQNIDRENFVMKPRFVKFVKIFPCQTFVPYGISVNVRPFKYITKVVYTHFENQTFANDTSYTKLVKYGTICVCNNSMISIQK